MKQNRTGSRVKQILPAKRLRSMNETRISEREKEPRNERNK